MKNEYKIINRLNRSLFLFWGIFFFWSQVCFGAGCFTPLAKIVRPYMTSIVLDSLKSEYHKFHHILREQNAAFIDFVKQKGRHKDVLFYHSENSILKDLNDRVFSDKNVSQALTIKYQKILLDVIGHDYFLKKNILYQYADYKTLRFVFKTKRNSNHFFKRLKIAEEKALNQYQVFLNNRDFNVYLERRLELTNVKDVSKWFLSGLSENPTVSALKARYFRNYESEHLSLGAESELIKNHIWNLRRELLSIEEELIEFYRKRSDDLINPALSFNKMGRFSLSEEVLGLFHKLKDTDLDFESAQLDIYDYLGIFIDRKIFRRHIEMIKKLNEFSPPVYQDFTRAVEFSRAGKGVISVDIANLGKEGLMSLYGTVIKTQLKDDFIDNISSAYWPVHFRLYEKYRPTARQVIRSSGLKYVHPIESGDDMLFFFKRSIEKEALENIVARTNATDIPEKLRIVEMPSRFLDSYKSISELRMSGYISRAEQLEKDIRSSLRSNFSRYFSRKTTIAVRVLPFSNKRAAYEVFLKVREGNYSLKFLKQVLQNFKTANSNIEYIIL